MLGHTRAPDQPHILSQVAVSRGPAGATSTLYTPPSGPRSHIQPSPVHNHKHTVGSFIKQLGHLVIKCPARGPPGATVLGKRFQLDLIAALAGVSREKGSGKLLLAGPISLQGARDQASELSHVLSRAQHPATFHFIKGDRLRNRRTLTPGAGRSVTRDGSMMTFGEQGGCHVIRIMKCATGNPGFSVYYRKSCDTMFFLG
ncbi:hypothetical protein DPEC_G00273170 [Dallia pectoralis]|uniref:Uncharacterized protein n=1 Tax=Dallia pectoralis TaxID=75939 RepID=A0ACC2FQB1_DALPE|nr:hypothetical protein DPEC_G00273170 [Dallia pectoralis]